MRANGIALYYLVAHRREITTVISASKIICMQRLQDAVRHFPLWTNGKVESQKWDALRAKFSDLYETELEASAKSRRKKKGHAVATLIAYCDEENDIVHWWLLATQGRGRINQRETLVCAQHRRIAVSGGYELVHDGTSWSWKYSEAQIAKLRQAIHYAIAGRRDDQLKSLVATLYATAGFRIARVQAGKLVAFTKSEWRRLRRSSESLPTFPTQMFYVRRLANQPKERQMAPLLTPTSSKLTNEARAVGAAIRLKPDALPRSDPYDEITLQIVGEWHALQNDPD